MRIHTCMVFIHIIINAALVCIKIFTQPYLYPRIAYNRKYPVITKSSKAKEAGETIGRSKCCTCKRCAISCGIISGIIGKTISHYINVKYEKILIIRSINMSK